MTDTTSTPVVRKVAVGEARPNRKRGGDLRVMLSPISVGATAGFMGAGTLEPGEYIAEHYHPYSEEFLYLVRGTITVRVGGQDIRLTKDEAVMIPINARHRIENDGDESAFVVFQLCPLAPRPELGHVDCEELPGEGTSPEVGGASGRERT